MALAKMLSRAWQALCATIYGHFNKRSTFNHCEPENAPIDKRFGVLVSLKSLVSKTVKTVKLLLSKLFHCLSLGIFLNLSLYIKIFGRAPFLLPFLPHYVPGQRFYRLE